MKVLVDGIVFQVARSGIARVWTSVLQLLVKYPRVQITMLDRGGCPHIPGVCRIAFPSYTGANTPADSLMIERIATDVGADVFASSYYTSPLTIPTVLLIHDMIPELFGFDLSERGWQEKEIAISFARHYVCVSANTKADLLKFYPEISDDRVIVAHCGVDRSVFNPAASQGLEELCRKHDLHRPYYLLVGSRGQDKGYKNASILFKALRVLRDFPFDIVCFGGKAEIQKEYLAGLPANVTVRRLEFDDKELACAYSGAQALVFPSLYEGFGLPVVEAMACGCPVITTRHGSLGEVSANAAEFVSGHNTEEMVNALKQVREPARRAELIELGFARSATFSWDTLAERLEISLRIAAAERFVPQAKKFFEDWKRLRVIQAAVDTSL